MTTTSALKPSICCRPTFCRDFTVDICCFITGSTVVLTCCKGDSQSQWETPIFGPSQPGNPLTDFDKIWNTWLHQPCDPLCQIWFLYVTGQNLSVLRQKSQPLHADAGLILQVDLDISSSLPICASWATQCKGCFLQLVMYSRLLVLCW